jgi:hypothetical protein
MFALANNVSLDGPVHSTTQEDVQTCGKLNVFECEFFIVIYTVVVCLSSEVHMYDNHVVFSCTFDN